MTGGTIVCGVGRSRGARDALQVAGALSERLGLRLVVAHVAPDRVRARSGEDLIGEMAAVAAVREPPDQRVAIGDRALGLAEIAAEEGADLIVIGSPSGRRNKFRRRGALERELESATSCPVVVAPRQTRRRSELRLVRAPAIGAS
ncbi:MAG TPA: universal stress protein [Thermoleophilaceae bacterium]